MELLFALQAAAPPEGDPTGGLLQMMLPFILIIAIFYFLIIRPQSKRQKERQKMLDALEKGQHVVTTGGVHGRVVGFKNDNNIVVIKVDDKVNLTVDRTAITTIKGQENEEKAS